MRNLKRALSLALASVMLVGMMVVGTSAASYPDVDSNDNVEAISVLQAVGVMQGDADTGEFRPDDQVSRNEMAVIMARLLLGPDAENYVGTHPFTDVPAWADKYVAACYNDGIIMGTSDTTYGGKDTVTAEQAAAMMLRALGYEKLEKIGQGYPAEIVKQANKISLFADVGANPKAAMTRNQIAQLGLNTLEATMVDADIEEGIVIEGVVTMPSKATYTDVEVEVSNGKNVYAVALDPGVNPTSTATKRTVQLGEKLYDGDLKKDNTSTNDDFGRPNEFQWTMKGVSNDDMPTVAKEAVATFTGKTSADDVASALSGYYADTDVPVNNKDKASAAETVDGVDLAKNGETPAKTIADQTANGKVYEFYANSNTNVISDVVVITYKVGKVTTVRETSKGTTYSVDNGDGSGVVYNPDEDTDDTAVLMGDVAKDDIVTTIRTNGKLYIYPTTTFEGVQSSRNTNKNTITVDGKTYDVAVGVSGVTIGNFANSKDSATFYVDQYGYVVKSEAIEDSSEYAVVDEIRFVDDGGIGSSKAVEARLVFTDGTSQIVKVTEINGFKAKDITEKTATGDNSTVGISASSSVVSKIIMSTKVSENTALNGKVVEYTKSGNEYKIDYDIAGNGTVQKNTTVSSKDAVTKGVPAFGNGAGNGTKDTIYVIKTDDAKYSVYTGYQNVTTVTASSSPVSVSYSTKDSKVNVVYVDATAAGATTGDTSTEVVYILDYEAYNEYKNDDNEVRYEYTKAVLNGDDSQPVVSQYKFTKNGIYEVKLTDGDTTEVKDSPTPAFETLSGYTKTAVSADSDDTETMYIETNGTGKGYNVKDADVYVIDGKNFYVGDGASGDKGDVVFIKVKGTWNGTDKDAITAEKVYVIKDEDKAQASSVADVTEQFTQNGKDEVTLTTALNGNVSVPADKKLILTTTPTSGTVTLGEGATLELGSGVTKLPTISGKGTVEVKGTIAAEQDLDALTTNLAGEKKSAALGDDPVTVSVPVADKKVTGAGTLAGFSSKSISTMLAANPGAESLSMYSFGLTDITSGSTITAKKYFGAGDTTGTDLDGVLGGDGYVCSETSLDISLLLANNVSKVVFTITKDANTKTVTFNIG